MVDVRTHEVMSCVINEDGIFSKLRFIAGEAADNFDAEDPMARLDADFILLTGAVRRLNEDLKKLLGGYAYSQ